MMGTVGYFLTDQLQTSRLLANPSGNATSSLDFDSFGNVTAGATASRYAYTGREIDSELDLSYHRARWYDTKQGRFISEDPIGFLGGDINLYGYVWRQPLNHRDSMGLDGWGNDLADWLDQKIESARRYWQYCDQEWVANGINNTVADIAFGFSDLLRVGSGVGDAIFVEDENGYGRAANVARDVARAAALFDLLARPVAQPGRVEVARVVREFAIFLRMKRDLLRIVIVDVMQMGRKLTGQMSRVIQLRISLCQLHLNRARS